MKISNLKIAFHF